ncbi:hypothetical protein [Kamptonema formosum]|uniref:hypothetical protein n=1 Tax=Kamptonema formosum TaxID=331992 RepID=UPI000348D410|nr:hypothetical protein [Oscillatoria sp. PCC 10802]
MANNKEEMFAEAAHYWDLQRLYQALAEAKRQLAPRARKGLTNTEKLYLRGLLCGNSPAEMARKLLQSPKGVEVFLCKTLYQYFKKMANSPDEPIGNWRNINTWLESAGYKTQSPPESKSKKYVPLEPLVNIVNIGLENNNTITIDIKVRLELPAPSESQKTDAPDTGEYPK